MFWFDLYFISFKNGVVSAVIEEGVTQANDPILNSN